MMKLDTKIKLETIASLFQKVGLDIYSEISELSKSDISYMELLSRILTSNIDPNKVQNLLGIMHISSKDLDVEYCQFLIKSLSNTQFNSSLSLAVMKNINDFLIFADQEDKQAFKIWASKESLSFENYFNYFKKNPLKNYSEDDLKTIVDLGLKNVIPDFFKKMVIIEFIENKSILKEQNFSRLISLVGKVPSFATILNDVYDLTKSEDLNNSKQIASYFSKYNKSILSYIKEAPQDWESVYPQIKSRSMMAKDFNIEIIAQEYSNFEFSLLDFILLSGDDVLFDNSGKLRAQLLRVFRESNKLKSIFGDVQVGSSLDEDKFSVFIQKTPQCDKKYVQGLLVMVILEVCKNIPSKERLDILIEQYHLETITKVFIRDSAKPKKF